MPRADIVVKLRAQRDFADDWRTTLAEEAADNIERLRSDVAAYKKDFRSIAEALNDPRCDLTHTMAELVAELRAELAACRAAAVYLFNCGYMRGHHDTVEACFVDIHDSDMRTYQSDVVAEVIDEALTARKGEGE